MANSAPGKHFRKGMTVPEFFARFADDAGPVEADETFVGGKARNMSAARRRRAGRQNLPYRKLVDA